MDVSYNNNYQIFEISTCMCGIQSFNKSTIQLQFELDLRVILFQISELLIIAGGLLSSLYYIVSYL